MGEVIILTFKEDEKEIIHKIMAVLGAESQTTKVLTPTVSTLSFSGLTIYPLQQQVLHQGTKIHLTYLEFSMLLYLAQQPGRVFTKEQIYQHLYQTEPMGEIDNIIYCLVRTLRKKLELDPRHPKYIITVRGGGYKFVK